MNHSPLRILLLSTILLALLAVPASAATPAQIHRDAADGSIDGDYSLADMRAADREVSSEQREYFGWEDVYREHVRSMTTPPVPARRPGRDSAPTSSASTRQPRSRGTTSADKSPARSDWPGSSDSAGDRANNDRAASSATGDDSAVNDEVVTAASPAADRVRRAGTSDTGLPIAWTLAAIPFVILGAGLWRMRRVRTRASDERSAVS